eukprot:4162547-Pyramimonas_sp.AAC.1
MAWDDGKSGAAMGMGVKHFDMADMGQFEENSMNMHMRVFEEADPCLWDIEVCVCDTITTPLTIRV